MAEKSTRSSWLSKYPTACQWGKEHVENQSEPRTPASHESRRYMIETQQRVRQQGAKEKRKDRDSQLDPFDSSHRRALFRFCRFIHGRCDFSRRDLKDS